MNNIVKSVVFAAVVLFAGIATMQFIYQQDATNAANMEPAAGEEATITNEDETAIPAADAMVEEQKDAVDAAAEKVGEVAEEAAEATEEAVEGAADAVEGAVDAVKEDATKAAE